MKTINKNFLIAFALATAFSTAQAMENQEKPTQSNSVSTTAEASAHKATDITPADKDLDAALFTAVTSKKLQQCQQLLAAKADPNKEHIMNDILKAPCIHIAIFNENSDICKVLIAAKAKINFRNAISPFINLAAMKNHTNIVKLLLENGAYANQKQQGISHTPIYSNALKCKNADLCRLLVEYGANDDITLVSKGRIIPTNPAAITYIKEIIAERTQYHLTNARILRTGLLPEILLFIAVNALAHIVIDYAIPANLADVILENKFQAALRHKELYGASESLAQTSPSTSPADNETKKD